MLNVHVCRINQKNNIGCTWLLPPCPYLSQRSFPVSAVLPRPSGHPLCLCPVGCTRVTSWHLKRGGKLWWKRWENEQTTRKKKTAVISSVSQYPQTKFHVPVSNFSLFSYATALSSTMNPFFGDDSWEN